MTHTVPLAVVAVYMEIYFTWLVSLIAFGLVTLFDRRRIEGAG